MPFEMLEIAKNANRFDQMNGLFIDLQTDADNDVTLKVTIVVRQ